MTKKRETLRDIFEKSSSILNLNDFYSKDMHYWEDNLGNVISVSRACEKITGYKEKEFLNNPNFLKSIIEKDDLPKWENRTKVLHFDDISGLTFRIRHKNGRIVWIEHDSQKLFNSDGEFIGFRSSIRDITKIKYTNEIINSSETVLFLWRNSTGYPVEFVSPNVEKVLGYTVKEFINGDACFNNLIHPDYFERVTEEIAKNIANPDPDFMHEPYKIIRKDGKAIWISDKTIVKQDKMGNITHFHGIITDITKEIEAKEALLKSEQRFSFSLEAAQIGSWEWDFKTRKIFLSKEVFSLLNIKPKNNIDLKKELFSLVFKDDKEYVDSVITQNILEKKSYELEHRIIRPDGEIRWILQVGKVFTDQEGNQSKIYGIVRDITERKKANELIYESERRYKDLVDNSPNGIIIHIDNLVVYANKKAVSILKIKKTTDIIGHDITDYIHKDYIHAVLNRISKIKQGANSGTVYDIKFIRSDNSEIYVSVANSSIDFHGQKGIQSVFYDTTKTKQIAKDLRRREELYRNVFNHSPLGILHYNTSGVITDCNSEFAAIIGTKKENLIGFNMLEKIKNDELRNAVADSLTKGEGYFENYYTSVITGRRLPAIGRFNAIYSTTNEIIGGVGLIENIESKVKNKKLQDALFEISNEASSTGTMHELYVKLHKIIKMLMPADNLYVAIYNQVKDEITFPYFVDIYEEVPKARKLKKGLTEYILKTKKSRIIRKKDFNDLDGYYPIGKETEIWVGVYLKFEGDYRGVLSIMDYENENAYTDNDLKVLQFASEQIVKVLDKKYADKRIRESLLELSKAKEELEKINSNKDRFFSIIAHDLRSPFNTLLGVTEMIADEADNLSIEEFKEITPVIHSSTRNLFKLIENLLSWSRLQMGTFMVNPVKLNVKELAIETTEVLKYSAIDKNITIKNEIDDLFVFADEECVKTVLRNLINNAIKFSHKNSTILLSGAIKESMIEISVKDNGVGIDSSIIPKLFNISQKTATVGTANEKGTGLGLILCKDLIEKNKGKIWVESKFGIGSTFTFSLPQFE